MVQPGEQTPASLRNGSTVSALAPVRRLRRCKKNWTRMVRPLSQNPLTLQLSDLSHEALEEDTSCSACSRYYFPASVCVSPLQTWPASCQHSATQLAAES